jgi:hypothetical protein
MQDVATELQQATAGARSARARAARRPRRPQLPGDELDLGRFAGRDGLPQPGHHGDLPRVFLLLSGDTFKRKLVKLTGPSLSRKKVTVHILDDINSRSRSTC